MSRGGYGEKRVYLHGSCGYHLEKAAGGHPCRHGRHGACIRESRERRSRGLRRGGRRGPVLSFLIDRQEPQDVAMLLDQEFGIAVRAGLHCAPLMHRAIGTYAQGGTVRINLTIPAWLNAFAEKNNINFSKLLQDTLFSMAQARSQ